MSIADLHPISSQPYRDKDPWLDVRAYLANGWAASGSQTFAVIAESNTLTFTIRVRADQATSPWIAENIPVRPAYVVRFQGHLDGEAVWMALNGAGNMSVNGVSVPVEAEISAVVTMPRGTL